MLDLGSNNTLVVPSVQVVPASDLPNIWNFKYLNSNAALPLLASSIFFACFLLHLSMLVISKRFYMLPLIAGLFLQVLSQIFKIIRVTSNSVPEALNYHALYSLTANLVPCLFLTTVARMLQRMLKASNPGCIPILVKVATCLITMLEGIAFGFQVYGLLVQLNPLLSRFWSTGNLITLIGSGIELFNLFWVWVLLSVIMRKERPRLTSQKHLSFNFWGFATVIIISVALIMVHTTSKFVFHLKNPEVEPFRNELLSFLLQSLPIALCAAFLIIFHPSRYDDGILGEEDSFFSPVTPMIPTLGTGAGRLRSSSMNRTSNASDPFWAVPPLTAECSISRQIRPHTRSTQNSYTRSTRFPSNANAGHLYGSQMLHCEQKSDDREGSHYEDSTVSEVFRIDSKVYRKGSPELNNDFKQARQNPLINRENSNLFSGQERQDIQVNSPKIQQEDFGMGFHYDDDAKDLCSTPVWYHNVDDIDGNPLWPRHINQTTVCRHNADEKKLSTVVSSCNESIYSGVSNE